MPKVLRHDPTPEEIVAAEEAALRQIPLRGLWAILDALASRPGVTLPQEAADALTQARERRSRAAQLRTR